MKKIAFLLILLSVSVITCAQEKRKNSPATVEKINGIPVFVFSVPQNDFEVVGKAVTTGHILQIAVNEQATVRDKTVKLVQKALDRQKKGKIPEFDAVLIELYKDRVKAIKFKGKPNILDAKVLDYEGIPVYFFSKPKDKYKEVATLDADYSLYAKRGLLLDKIESMLNRTLDKEKEGKIPHFDAVIISPDDLKETLIVFY